MVRSRVTIVVGIYQAKLLKRLVQQELQGGDLNETTHKKLNGLLAKIRKGIQDSKGSEVK